MEVLKRTIVKFVKNSNSSLQLDGDVENFDNELLFSTRDNGDVMTETHSNIDYNDARNLEISLSKTFKNNITTSLETVDEWVMLYVTIKK